MRKNYEQKIRQFNNIVRLASGELAPKTTAQHEFLRVVEGSRQPTSEWEVIYAAWQNHGKPDIDEFFNSGLASTAVVAHALSNFKPASKTKTSKSPPAKKMMSAAAAKKLDKPRRSQAEIDRTHRKSGYHKQSIRIVQGGRVNPR